MQKKGKRRGVIWPGGKTGLGHKVYPKRVFYLAEDRPNIKGTGGFPPRDFLGQTFREKGTFLNVGKGGGCSRNPKGEEGDAPRVLGEVGGPGCEMGTRDSSGGRRGEKMHRRVGTATVGEARQARGLCPNKSMHPRVQRGRSRPRS